MDGVEELLVNVESARNCGESAHSPDFSSSIKGSHSELVKFGSQDHRYDTVRDRLRSVALYAIDTASMSS